MYMTTTKYRNLIAYWVLFGADDNYRTSMLDYITEKYDLFFGGVPDIDIITDYNKKIGLFKSDIDSVMSRYRISVDDENFHKFYITFCICYDEEITRSGLMNIYNYFFKTYNNISDINRVNVLHQVLRTSLHDYISNDKMYYRIKLLEGILNKK